MIYPRHSQAAIASPLWPKYVLPALERQGPKETIGNSATHMIYISGRQWHIPTDIVVIVRFGSLVYILNQTQASERTRTVHQVLVGNQKEGGDPGTCQAALLVAALTYISLNQLRMYQWKSITYRTIRNVTPKRYLHIYIYIWNELTYIFLSIYEYIDIYYINM